MSLRALKTEDELAAVPLTEPVLVELPGFEGVTDDDGKAKEGDKPSGDAKRVTDDLAAMKAQIEAANAREKAERDRAEKAERIAKERDEENRRLKVDRERDESSLINNGLSAAQAERDAAVAEYQRAFDAGDSAAVAKANSRISRAEARIVQFESGAAELAERAETRKSAPEPVKQEERPVDFVTAVRSNPNLLETEREWLITHQAKFSDPNFNKELDVAYQRAVKKGLTRGTPDYFAFIEEFTEIKPKTESRSEHRSDDMQVSAPVSRNERDSDYRPSNGKVMLTPEQREIAANLGISDIEYAKQVVAFDSAKRADPERFR